MHPIRDFERMLERVEATEKMLSGWYGGGPEVRASRNMRFTLWRSSCISQDNLDLLLPLAKQYLSKEWCFAPGAWEYLRLLDEHHPYFHTLRHDRYGAFILGARPIFLPSVSPEDLRIASLIFRVWPLKVLLDIESDWLSRTTIFEKYIYHNIDLFGRRVERMACVRRVVHVDDLVDIVAGFLGPR
jgi:hypothetical protein